MTIGVTFDKARAQQFLDALANGTPISPADSRGWTQTDLLALAGACHFTVMSLGPAKYKKDTHSEHLEAQEETWPSDISNAIEWCSQGMIWVQDGGYDTRFEQVHTAALTIQEDGGVAVVPVSGFKSLK